MIHGFSTEWGVPTLVHTALFVRRATRTYGGFVAAIAFAALVLGRVFDRAHDLDAVVFGLLWLVALAVELTARVREGARLGRVHDLELGLLVLFGAHAVVQRFGSASSSLYALVYVVVAFGSAFARAPMGAVLVGSSVMFECALVLLHHPRDGEIRSLVLRCALLVGFGVLHHAFTRAEIARVRETSRRALDDERERVRSDARLYRLVGAATDANVGDEERVFRATIEEIQQTSYYLLDLLKRSLDLHTCVLLLRDETDEAKLRVAESVSESDLVVSGTIPLGEGAVGAVARRGLVTNLEHVKPGYAGLPYYSEPANVRAFLGVPVVENGAIRGALCVDRIDDRPFTERDQALVERAIHQILRAMQNERVFVQLERAKREHTVLLRTSQALGAAMTESQVLDAALASIAEIAPYDFAAVTSYDERTKRHGVLAVRGENTDEVARLSFRDNASLIAMAIKNRHYLPYRGDYDDRQIVFAKRETLRGMRSLLILPLLVQEKATGALVVASRRPGAFGDSIRQTLSLLSNHLSVALANAQSVRRLEELATTDGLTGCLNKRAFIDELEKRIRLAGRFGKKLSLVITDIDHFKAVNDVYGHATGDVVIRELGTLLQRVKRETDVVGRFGGEEFCVLCEETDTKGASLLAERVREELGNTVFHTEMGKLKVTCSLGVATFPNDARDKGSLFDAADRALYDAKHAGRNRVCTAKHDAREAASLRTVDEPAQ